MGVWVKRLRESVFGFKLHVKTGLDLGLIRAVDASSASVHDSRVDLSEPGDVVIRDKGYFGEVEGIRCDDAERCSWSSAL